MGNLGKLRVTLADVETELTEARASHGDMVKLVNKYPVFKKSTVADIELGSNGYNIQLSKVMSTEDAKVLTSGMWEKRGSSKGYKKYEVKGFDKNTFTVALDYNYGKGKVSVSIIGNGIGFKRGATADIEKYFKGISGRFKNFSACDDEMDESVITEARTRKPRVKEKKYTQNVVKAIENSIRETSPVTETFDNAEGYTTYIKFPVEYTSKLKKAVKSVAKQFGYSEAWKESTILGYMKTIEDGVWYDLVFEDFSLDNENEFSMATVGVSIDKE